MKRVRDVCKQLPLGRDELLDSVRHPIEIPAEIRQFIMPSKHTGIDAGLQLFAGDVPRRPPQLFDRAREMTREQETEDAAHQEHEQHAHAADRADPAAAPARGQEFDERSIQHRRLGKTDHHDIRVAARVDNPLRNQPARVVYVLCTVRRRLYRRHGCRTAFSGDRPNTSFAPSSKR